MSGSFKATADRLKDLEKQKLSLQAEVEDLRKMAEAKALSLSNEISNLKEDIDALKSLMAGEKPQSAGAQNLQDKKIAYLNELGSKTSDELNQLGNQVFSSMPYSQNLDKWMNDLGQTLSYFEANFPAIDDQFTTEKTQILQGIESQLSAKKTEESNIDEISKELAEKNSLLEATEKQYDEKLKDLTLKRNLEVEPLNIRIKDLEEEIQSKEQSNKRKILLRKPEKLPETKQSLKSAKDELDITIKNISSEEDNLRAEFENKKKEIMAEVEQLQKDMDRLKIDTSLEPRQTACNALANSVNNLIKREISKDF